MSIKDFRASGYRRWGTFSLKSLDAELPLPVSKWYYVTNLGLNLVIYILLGDRWYTAGQMLHFSSKRSTGQGRPNCKTQEKMNGVNIVQSMWGALGEWYSKVKNPEQWQAKSKKCFFKIHKPCSQSTVQIKHHTVNGNASRHINTWCSWGPVRWA